jgi:hypothetical protein
MTNSSRVIDRRSQVDIFLVVEEVSEMETEVGNTHLAEPEGPGAA